MHCLKGSTGQLLFSFRIFGPRKELAPAEANKVAIKSIGIFLQLHIATTISPWITFFPEGVVPGK